LRPVDVDDLLVHEVGAQEDLVGPLLEFLDVDPGRGELGAGCIERADGAPWHEDRATVGLDHQARHGRVLVLDRNDEVRDLANLLVVPISNRPADRFAQVEHPGPPAELVHRAQSRRDGELCMRRAGAGPKRHQTASCSIVATSGTARTNGVGDAAAWRMGVQVVVAATGSRGASQQVDGWCAAGPTPGTGSDASDLESPASGTAWLDGEHSEDRWSA